MKNHTPVLLGEAVEGLSLNEDSAVIDATADGGGHTEAILKILGPKGRLVAIDWDSSMVSRLQQKFGSDRRIKIFHRNFAEIAKLAGGPDAILFDLGLSSLQLNARLDQDGQASGPSAGFRGFSFQRVEPLLMTFDEKAHPTAKEFLEKASEKELEAVIRTYGEESFAKRISRAIIEARKKKPIETSKELSEIIAKARPRTGRLHPATKTFQALRIQLNHELENLEKGLRGAWKILKPRGRIAVISYHSLEDRIVKNFFREASQTGKGRLINKKPIIPSREEILKNPRSRSAKLRIIEKNKYALPKNKYFTPHHCAAFDDLCRQFKLCGFGGFLSGEISAGFKNFASGFAKKRRISHRETF